MHTRNANHRAEKDRVTSTLLRFKNERKEEAKKSSRWLDELACLRMRLIAIVNSNAGSSWSYMEQDG